jgi:uncharacterized repeat protein (TIGR02543 family)
MFSSCENLTALDVSYFDTSNVVSTKAMFYLCLNLRELNLSVFDMSNVTDTTDMLDYCSNLTTLYTPKVYSSQIVNLPASYYNISDSTDTKKYTSFTSGTFSSSVELRKIFTLTVNPNGGTWEGSTASQNFSIAYGQTKTISNPTRTGDVFAGWTISGNGSSLNDTTFTMGNKNTTLTAKWVYTIGDGVYADYDKSTKTLSIYGSGIIDYNYTGSATDSYSSSFQTGRFETMMNTIGKSNITSIVVSNTGIYLPTNCAYMFYNYTNLTTLDVSNLDTSQVTDMRYMFCYCKKLTALDVSNFDTSQVTNVSCMFYSCTSLTTLDVSNFDTSQVTDMSYMFYYCNKLTTLDVSNFDTSQVTDMSYMFYVCYSLTTLDVSNFDTSKVTNMQSMFSDCSRLSTLDVSNFDTSQVTDMEQMFEYCSNLTTLDVSNFNTSQVTDMMDMFVGCSRLTTLDLSNFDTNQVTDMRGMFESCSSLITLDLSKFDTSKVTNMVDMFDGCSSLITLDLSNFDTSQVTTMYDMFCECSSLTILNLSNFNTSQVTDMEQMFEYCSNLTTLDVSNFDTSQVEYMDCMFYNCSSLTTLDLSSFDTSQVENMYDMFYNCSSLTSLDLSSFDTSQVEYMYDMFSNCSNLTSLDLSNFDTSNVSYMEDIFYNCTDLITIYTPKINSEETVELPAQYYNASNVNDTNIYESFDNTTFSESVKLRQTDKDYKLGNGVYAKFDNTTGELVIFGDGTDDLTIDRTRWDEMKTEIEDSVESIIVKNNEIYLPANCSYMFSNFSSLTELDLSNFDTSQVTSMERMFESCSSLTRLDLSNFDTSKVTNMSYMFEDCSSLTTLDLSNFDTTQVISMEGMFYYCSSLTTLDLSNFDTIQVIDMSEMFYNCNSLTTLDVSNFDTSNVTRMNLMFEDCSSLTSLNLSNFDTTQVTDMCEMFDNCSSLTSLDLNSFDTSQVTDMSYMFDNCSSLTSLNLSNFDTSKVTDMQLTFYNCSSLTNLDLSNFDTSQVTSMYYMFFNCTNLITIYTPKTNSSKTVELPAQYYNASNVNDINIYESFDNTTFFESIELKKIQVELHTVTVNPNGGTWDSSTSNKNFTLEYLETTTISNPSKTGYTFTEWVVSGRGSSINDTIFTMGYEDTTLTANWTINSYKVTYDYSTNGGTSSTKTEATVSYNSAIDLTPTATKSGWTFVGWNTNKDAQTGLTSLTIGTSNVTLYAIYKKDITATVKYYNNQTSTETKTIYNTATSTSFTLLAIASQTVSSVTYTGRGYSETATANATVAANSGASVTLSADKTYYANYSTEITGTFYYYSGTAQTSTTAKATRYMNYTGTFVNSNFTVPTATALTGYTQRGWSTGTTGTSTVTTPTTANTSYYMSYSYTVTLTYNANGGSLDSITTQTGTAYMNSTGSKTGASITITSAIPTKTGYTFGNAWNTNQSKTGTSYTKATAYSFTSNATLYAEWTANTDTAYVVKHWQQNVGAGSEQNSTNYTLKDTENKSGTTGTSVTPAVKTYTGFTAPTAQSITISADGTTVVNYYYTRNSYSVTLNKEAGITAVTGNSSYQYGASVTIDATVANGYTWSSWSGTHTTTTKQYTFTMPASNVTDTANATINSYTLTINPNGGAWESNTESQNFTLNYLATKTISNPSKVGYTFTGWTLTGTASTLSGTTFTMGYANASLVANWTANTYTVKYDGNGATSGSTADSIHTYDVAKTLTANGYARAYTVTYNHNYTGSENTSKTATYSFAGWATTSTSSKAYDDKATVSNLSATNGATVNLYAVWNSSSITYVPTRTGYTFGGWYTESECTNSVAGTDGAYTPTANITLYAKWTANTYTVKYNGNGSTSGSTASSTHTYNVAQNLTANGFARAYTVTYNHNYTGSTNTSKTATYSFAGWATTSTGTKAYDNSASVTNLSSTNGATVNLYAIWNSASVTYVPTRTGYTFGGWYTESSCTNSVAGTDGAYTPTANITLYAKWTANTYTVKYNGNGSTSGSTANSTHTYDVAQNLTTNGFARAYTVTYNHNYTGSSNTTKTATYSFAGWATTSTGTKAYNNSESVINLSSTNGATVNLYAIWNSASVTYVPTRTGYTFGGWYTESSCTNSVAGTDGAYTPTANITLYAKWTAITYTVKYNGNGSTSGSTSNSTHTYDVAQNLTANGFVKSYTVTYNHNYTGSTNTTKTATYNFAGWSKSTDGVKAYDNSASVTNLSSTNGATVNLYALWNSSSVTYVPTRTGYTFGGWYKEADCTNSVAGTDGVYTPTSNITLYAKWTINSYKVTYDYSTNGGTTASKTEATVNYNSAIDLTPTATKSGWTFVGWNTNKDATEALSSSTMGTSNVTLYAIYKKDITTTVKYYNNQTSTETKTIYNTATSTSFTLPAIANQTVSSVTYTGRGYSESATANATIVANSGASVTLSADKTYYANYSAEITGTFYYYSGSAQTSSTVKATRYMNYTGTYVNTNFTVPTATTLTGYTQRGWSTSTSGTGTITSTPTTANTSYYMSYTYTVTLTYNANGGSLDSITTQTGTAYMNSTGEKTGASITITSAIPTKTGYTFGNAWNTNQTKTGTSYTKAEAYSFTSSATLYAEWSADTDIAYTVKHWQQNVGAETTQNSTNYTLKDTETKKGTSDTVVMPAVKTYTGFTAPTAQSVTISADGSTVVNYYYTRNSYSVTLSKGTGITTVTGASSYQYGASVTIDATVANGYTWSSWSGTHSTIAKQYTFTMPASNVTDTANTTINAYTLTVNPNGGTWESNTESQEFILDYLETKTISNPSKAGYTFAGWTLSGTASTLSGTTFTMGYANASLTANWTANTYTVKYDGNGATSGSTADSIHTYDVAKTLTANGYERAYTVTYNHNYTGSENTSKTATYSFAGWATTSTSSKAYDDKATVSNLSTTNGATVNLYALWNSASVTYVPVRTGYTFGGWYTESECTNSVSGTNGVYTPTANITLYAKWTANTGTAYVVKHWQQNIGADTTENSTNYTLKDTENKTGTSDTVVMPAVKSYTGFTAPTAQSITILADGSTVVNYYYTRNSYNVTLSKGTGITVVTGASSYQYGASVTIGATVANGYAWSGWSGTHTTIAKQYTFTMPATNVTDTANATINAYTLTVNPNGGTWESNTESQDFTLDYLETKTISNPNKAGYTFAGWTLSGTASSVKDDTETKTVTFTMGYANASLTANWTANTYTVKYNGNGATSGNTADSIHTYDVAKNLTANGYERVYTVTYDHNYAGSTNTTKASTYSFAGWAITSASSKEYDDKASVSNLSVANGATVNLYAVWNSENITYVPVRTGYTFEGWYKESSCTNSVTGINGTYTPTENITLYAKWKANTDTAYVVKHWQQNIGADAIQNSTNYTLKDTENKTGTTNTSIAPAVKVYNGFTTPVAQNITISADGSTVLNYYYTRNSYSVTLNKGTGIEDVTGTGTYQYGASVTIDATVENGYTWSGWTGTHTTISKQYTFTMPASNVINIANTTIDAYTLTVNPNGGTWENNTESKNFTLNYLATKTIENPSKTGYTFTGWTLSGTTSSIKDDTDTKIFTMGTENASLTANWTANTYTVKYNGNGATAGTTADSTHTYDVAKNLTSNEYERAYTVTYNHNYNGSENTEKTAVYSFEGWATSPTGTKTYDDKASVSNLSIANGEIVNLYAVWTSENITYVPTRYGYTFGGWYTESECTNSVTGTNGVYKPTENITLYAKWEVDEEQTKTLSYTVEFYINEEKQEKDTVVITKTVQVLEQDTLEMEESLIDNNKYENYEINTSIEIPKTVQNNEVVEIHYRNKEISYKVEYYYNGYKDDELTETKTAETLATIDKYEDKVKTGYIFESIENFPLTVESDADKNVIKVYYKINQAEKKELSYEIVYYKDGEEVATRKVSKEVQVLLPDTIEVNEDLIERNKYEGYTFVGTEPEEIPEYIENGGIINVYYEIRPAKIVVKYIDEETGEELSSETIEGKYGDSYVTVAKDFKGYALVKEDEEGNSILPENAAGTMNEDEIVINYYYKRISAEVVEKHIDKISGEILDNTIYEGNEGDEYTASSKEFEGYDLVEEDEEGNSMLPENATGTMTQELIEVKYYYIRKTSVKVEYLDRNTGEEIAEAEVIEGHQGDEYTASSKEFENYTLIEVDSEGESKLPENATGTMQITANEDGTISTETIVTYYYAKKSAGVIESHVDIKTGRILEDIVYEGLEGDKYTTSSKEFEGYDLVEKDSDENIILPANAEGTMGFKLIEVKYYYIRKTTVRIEYIDYETGESLSEDTILNGYEDNYYKVGSKQIEGYTLMETDSEGNKVFPTNNEGTMQVIINDDGTVETETVVTYYYEKDVEPESPVDPDDSDDENDSEDSNESNSENPDDNSGDLDDDNLENPDNNSGDLGDDNLENPDNNSGDLDDDDSDDTSDSDINKNPNNSNNNKPGSSNNKPGNSNTTNSNTTNSNTINSNTANSNTANSSTANSNTANSNTTNSNTANSNTANSNTANSNTTNSNITNSTTANSSTANSNTINNNTSNSNTNTNTNNSTSSDNSNNNADSNINNSNSNAINNNNSNDSNSNNSSNTSGTASSGNGVSLPSTGDVLPVVAIGTIIFVIIANIAQMIISRRKNK